MRCMVVSRVGTRGSLSTFSIMPISWSMAFTPAGLPSTKRRLKRSVNLWWIFLALSNSPFISSLSMRENSLGRALPITDITPTAPQATIGKVRASSPLMTSKVSGLFFIISSICSRFPDASLIPTMLWQSRASLTVVSAERFTPVLPGTLYTCGAYYQRWRRISRCE